MQSIGPHYVQFVSQRYRRTGTLWEGRHKASLVQEERYLLRCYRYIELNPVKAGMVKHPADYRWSSFRANAYGWKGAMLSAHPVYDALGPDEATRKRAYRDLFRVELGDAEVSEVRQAAQCAMPLGSSGFQEHVEKLLGRRIGFLKQGRPRSPGRK